MDKPTGYVANPPTVSQRPARLADPPPRAWRWLGCLATAAVTLIAGCSSPSSGPGKPSPAGPETGDAAPSTAAPAAIGRLELSAVWPLEWRASGNLALTDGSGSDVSTKRQFWLPHDPTQVHECETATAADGEKTLSVTLAGLYGPEPKAVVLERKQLPAAGSGDAATRLFARVLDPTDCSAGPDVELPFDREVTGMQALDDDAVAVAYESSERHNPLFVFSESTGQVTVDGSGVWLAGTPSALLHCDNESGPVVLTAYDPHSGSELWSHPAGERGWDGVDCGSSIVTLTSTTAAAPSTSALLDLARGEQIGKLDDVMMFGSQVSRDGREYGYWDGSSSSLEFMDSSGKTRTVLPDDKYGQLAGELKAVTPETAYIQTGDNKIVVGNDGEQLGTWDRYSPIGFGTGWDLHVGTWENDDHYLVGPAGEIPQ